MRMFFAEHGTGEPVSLGAALLSGKKVGPDVLELLMEDHRVVLGWFDWFASLEKETPRRFVLRNILNALWAHMAIEEEIFYPEAAAKLGDDSMVGQARKEHEAAKAIMRRLEGALQNDSDALSPQPVDELHKAIAQHVMEEEGELFPLVRETNMDRYATGRSCAARHVERLMQLTATDTDAAPFKETAPMPISKEEARDFLIVGLRNIHATVNEGKTMVQAQLNRLENYPMLEAKLQAHRAEKDMQLSRIEQILEKLGNSPSSIKDTTMSIAATLSSLTTAMAGDEILKNSFATYGLANFEAAAYETLILFAEVAEEFDALAPLQQSLSEERAMAAFIAENLRGTGLRFLQLKSEGRQASH